MSDNIDLLKFFLWVAFGGWVLFLSSERNKIVEDIKEMKKDIDQLMQGVNAIDIRISNSYLTKQEHRDFDNRISQSIDRLTERIDRVLILKPVKEE